MPPSANSLQCNYPLLSLTKASVVIMSTHSHNIPKDKLLELYLNQKLSTNSIDKRGVVCNKDCWRLTTAKKQSLWNFIKLIKPFHKHQQKLKDLKKVEENLKLRNNLPYCRPIIL